MVCLDSDFLIDLTNRDPRAIQKMKELQSKREPIFTTTINAGELYKGAYRSRNRELAINSTKQFLQLFSLLTLEHESTRLWAQLSEELKSKTIGDLDLLIASIALTKGETLITRNVKHFERVPGLTVQSW